MNDDEWQAIWGDDADAAERDRVIQSACATLDELLSREPAAAVEIDRAFAENLTEAVTTDTFAPIDRFLMLYAGADIKFLIAWTALRPDERLPVVVRLGPPAAGAFVRGLVARHTPAIADAYNSWGELPDNWRTINRKHSIDGDRGKLIAIDITTFSGSAFRVQGPLGSIMGLTIYLLEALMEQDLGEYGEEPVVDEFRAFAEAAVTWAAPAEQDVLESGNGATSPKPDPT